MKISKRDIKFFLLGALTVLILEFALDPQGAIDDFKKGFNDATSECK